MSDIFSNVVLLSGGEKRRSEMAPSCMIPSCLLFALIILILAIMMNHISVSCLEAVAGALLVDIEHRNQLI